MNKKVDSSDVEAPCKPRKLSDETKSLFEAVSSSIVIIDEKKTIIYATPTFKWAIGYDYDDISGMNIDTLLSDRDNEEFANLFNLTLDSDRSFILPEISFKHKRGAYIYMEGDISNKLDTPLINGIMINLHDITQRKLYEMDYARLLGAIRISSDSFMLSDIEGNILFANNAAMLLYGEADKRKFVGRNIAELIADKTLDEMIPPDQGDATISFIEHSFLRHDKKLVPVETGISRMQGTDKNHIGYVYITRNITERKRSEEEILKYKYQLEDLVKERTDELNSSMAQLRNTLEGVVGSMAYTVETKDPYTAGHQKRVAELACALAMELGLPETTVDGIKMAALIHDLGNIYVPAEILTRHGKLDEVEFMLIKKHPQVGFDILKSIDFPWPIAEIIHQHHEKMDGSGYPQGLKGSQILLESRIICIADVVESMAIYRPYREGLGIDIALEEIQANKGILFDADIVDVCVNLFKNKGFTFSG